MFSLRATSSEDLQLAAALLRMTAFGAVEESLHLRHEHIVQLVHVLLRDALLTRHRDWPPHLASFL